MMRYNCKSNVFDSAQRFNNIISIFNIFPDSRDRQILSETEKQCSLLKSVAFTDFC